MRARLTYGLTITATLLLACGLTLGLWVLAGYDVTRRMSEAEREVAAIDARYARAQETLSNVRPRLLLASVYVREALLDSDPRTAADSRRRVRSTLLAADDALGQYEPVLDLSG